MSKFVILFPTPQFFFSSFLNNYYDTCAHIEYQKIYSTGQSLAVFAPRPASVLSRPPMDRLTFCCQRERRLYFPPLYKKTRPSGRAELLSHRGTRRVRESYRPFDDDVSNRLLGSIHFEDALPVMKNSSIVMKKSDRYISIDQ